MDYFQHASLYTFLFNFDLSTTEFYFGQKSTRTKTSLCQSDWHTNTDRLLAKTAHRQFACALLSMFSYAAWTQQTNTNTHLPHNYSSTLSAHQRYDGTIEETGEYKVETAWSHATRINICMFANTLTHSITPRHTHTRPSTNVLNCTCLSIAFVFVWRL